MANLRRAPAGFWLVAVLLMLWNAAGCYACLQQWRLGPEAMGTPTPYQRELYAALPGWYNYVYALAVGAGLIASLLLLARSAVARPLFAVSTLGVVVMFGYMFLATDIIARMGFVTAAGFPIVVFLLALFGWWFAQRSIVRGWIG